MHINIYVVIYILHFYIYYDSSKYVWNIPSSIVFSSIKALLGMQTTTSDHALRGFVALWVPHPVSGNPHSIGAQYHCWLMVLIEGSLNLDGTASISR